MRFSQNQKASHLNNRGGPRNRITLKMRGNHPVQARLQFRLVCLEPARLQRLVEPSRFALQGWRKG